MLQSLAYSSAGAHGFLGDISEHQRGGGKKTQPRIKQTKENRGSSYWTKLVKQTPFWGWAAALEIYQNMDPAHKRLMCLKSFKNLIRLYPRLSTELGPIRSLHDGADGSIPASGTDSRRCSQSPLVTPTRPRLRSGCLSGWVLGISTYQQSKLKILQSQA